MKVGDVVKFDLVSKGGWGGGGVVGGGGGGVALFQHLYDLWSSPKSFQSFQKLIQSGRYRQIFYNSLDIWYMYDRTQLIYTGNIVYIFE